MAEPPWLPEGFEGVAEPPWLPEGFEGVAEPPWPPEGFEGVLPPSEEAEPSPFAGVKPLLVTDLEPLREDDDDLDT